MFFLTISRDIWLYSNRMCDNVNTAKYLPYLVLVFFKHFSLISMSPIVEALRSINGQYQIQWIHKEQKCLEWADNHYIVELFCLTNLISPEVQFRVTNTQTRQTIPAVLLKAIANILSCVIREHCGHIVNNRHCLPDQLDSSPPNGKQSLRDMRRNHSHLCFNIHQPSQVNFIDGARWL